MPATQEFRRRIKSVNNTRQITRAMEMVSSVKMQKAVRTINQGRAYIQNSWNMLLQLAELSKPEDHPLLSVRPVKKICLIIVASDRGLCGSFNQEILKKTKSFCKGEIEVGKNSINNKEIDTIIIGKKGQKISSLLPETNLIASFTDMGDEINFTETRPISTLIIDGYKQAIYDEIFLIYTHFESSLHQIPTINQLLPITKEHIDIPRLWEHSKNIGVVKTVLEPDPHIILERILEEFIRMQVYGAILESNASEHSTRMLAMNNATENAKNLISELTLIYNSVRQDTITREIAEIASATESMK